MFVLLVHVDVREEHRAEFLEALRANAAHSVADEPGCLRFDVSEVEDAPNRFVFYEVYTSEDAWQAHRQSPHFLDYKRGGRSGPGVASVDAAQTALRGASAQVRRCLIMMTKRSLAFLSTSNP